MPYYDHPNTNGQFQAIAKKNRLLLHSINFKCDQRFLFLRIIQFFESLLLYTFPTHQNFALEATIQSLGKHGNLNLWKIVIFAPLLIHQISCDIIIWVDILYQSINAESCILSQPDSSSTRGWLRKSNFSEKDDEIMQMTTAYCLAYLILNSNSYFYSQWFSGHENRNFHLSNADLTYLITSFILKHLPFVFCLSPLT